MIRTVSFGRGVAPRAEAASWNRNPGNPSRPKTSAVNRSADSGNGNHMRCDPRGELPRLRISASTDSADA